MDGLSAAVAVISLIDTARRLASEGYKYIKAVKNCDQDVQRLIGEISALEGLLHHVEKLFSEKEAEEAANGTVLSNLLLYTKLSSCDQIRKYPARAYLLLRVSTNIY